MSNVIQSPRVRNFAKSVDTGMALQSPASPSLKVLTQSASGGVLPTSSKLKNLARGRWKQAIFKTKIVNKLTSMTDTEKRYKKHALAVSPYALKTKRLDVTAAFKQLFDHDASGDKQTRVIGLIRRMRASSYRMGGEDWNALFRTYDRDGSGQLDEREFERAVLKIHKKVPREDIQEMFKRIDLDNSGEITANEFRNFLGNVGNMIDLTGKGSESLEQRMSLRSRGVPFVCEYIAVERCTLREGAQLNSKIVGYLVAGEIVAVTQVVGHRMRCQRLRWSSSGTNSTSGWASELANSGKGRMLLEKLPRDQWSSGDLDFYETAVAERVANLNNFNKMTVALSPRVKSRAQKDRSRTERRATGYGPRAGFGGLARPVCADQAGKVAQAALASCSSKEAVRKILNVLEQTPRERWVNVLGASGALSPRTSTSSETPSSARSRSRSPPVAQPTAPHTARAGASSPAMFDMSMRHSAQEQEISQLRAELARRDAEIATAAARSTSVRLADMQKGGSSDSLPFTPPGSLDYEASGEGYRRGIVA